MFHRYLFLVMQSALEACRNGVLVGSSYISPHLLMIVADQPQERVLYAIKNAVYGSDKSSTGRPRLSNSR